ncbi:MAG TPA: MBL fold metallo-hydrolase [Rectinemataceae bacterium]
MQELSLVSLAGGSSYLPGPTNIGFVQREGRIWLIDSGNDKESGKRLLKIADSLEMSIAGIINTHSNADHIGGNAYIQQVTDCPVWAPAGEVPFIEDPRLEAVLLWGGRAPKELRSKFFEAKPSKVTRRLGPDEEGGSTEGFAFIPLPGHFVDMMGVLSPDGVFYMGDAVFDPAVLEKYKLPFIYDASDFSQSLDTISAVRASWYLPSHGEPCRDPSELVEANRKALERAKEALHEALAEPRGFDEILQSLCSRLGIDLDMGQYALVGSTLRSLLSCLREEGSIACRFERGRLFWYRG